MTYTLPPGPRPKPVVGNILDFRRGQLNFVTGLQRKYGKASTFYFGQTPMIMFATPEAVRYVLVENAKNFTIRDVAKGLRLLLGDGLLTTDGEFHRRQRLTLRIVARALFDVDLTQESHALGSAFD